MFGAPGAKKSKKIQSGVPDWPTAKQLFVAMLIELLESGTWTWAHFEDNQSKNWVEVALDTDDLLINFRFPFRDTLAAVFSERRIKVPECWKIEYFKKKKAATFRVSGSDVDTIASFLDVVFRKLYECPDNYSVSGSLLC